jgi:hypothetical protein
MLEFATFTNAPHKRFSGDCDDGLQQAYGRLSQLIEGLFRRRKQTLQLGDGVLSLLALDADRLIAAHGISSNSAGFLLDCRGERANGERVAFCVCPDECRPLDFERLADHLDRML